MYTHLSMRCVTAIVSPDGGMMRLRPVQQRSMIVRQGADAARRDTLMDACAGWVDRGIVEGTYGSERVW